MSQRAECFKGNAFFFLLQNLKKFYILQTVDKHNRDYLAEKQSNWNRLFISSITWYITLEFIFLQFIQCGCIVKTEE